MGQECQEQIDQAFDDLTVAVLKDFNPGSEEFQSLKEANGEGVGGGSGILDGCMVIRDALQMAVARCPDDTLDLILKTHRLLLSLAGSEPLSSLKRPVQGPGQGSG